MFDDAESPAKPAGVMIGEDLSRLSCDELEERLDALDREKERVSRELKSKRAGRDAADSIFAR